MTRTKMYQFSRQMDDSEHDGFCVLDMISEFVGYAENHEPDIIRDCRKFIVGGDHFAYKLWTLRRYDLEPLKDGHIGITKDSMFWHLDSNGKLQETDFNCATTEVPLRAEWMPDEQHA